MGIVMDKKVKWYPFLQVSLISGIADDNVQGFAGKVESLELQQYIDAHKYSEQERELIPIARKFHPNELLKYLKKNLPFGDLIDDYNQVLKEIPEDEVKEQLWEYLLPKYHKLLDRFSAHPLCFINDDAKGISSKTITAVEFSNKKAHPQLSVNKADVGYTISLSWNIDDSFYDFKEVDVLNNALLQHDFTIYSIGNLKEVALVEHFLPDGQLNISPQDWDELLKEKLMKWSQQVHVVFGEEIVERIAKSKPEYRLNLQERDQMLVFKPSFVYDGVEINWGYFGDVIVPNKGIVKIIQRNETAEQEFINHLRNLHTDMHQNLKQHFFYMVATSVLAQNWFFRFIEEMRDWNVTLDGFEKLKNLRINTNKPQTRVNVSSGIDWFDTSVDLVFGEQAVSITDVKKAISQKQNFVKLEDGSIGLLPDEWLKKYALLIKMGEEKKGKLRLKEVSF